MSFLPEVPLLDDDSEDLSNEEVERAVETSDEKQLVRILTEELSPGHASIGKGDARYAVLGHQIRRRKPHLYLRTRLGCPGEPEKTLVFRVDWAESQARTHERRM